MHNPDARPSVLVHVAANVRRLRQAAALSQQALAERAEVSRRMLVNVEKGEVNVSLATLDRLAAALGVAFHVLVRPPESQESAHIDEAIWAGENAESYARLLASQPARQEVELWSWSLAPGERYVSAGDSEGWQEMLVVIAGQLRLELESGPVTLTAGDFHVFPSDRPYGYYNPGTERLRFIRNLLH